VIGLLNGDLFCSRDQLIDKALAQREEQIAYVDPRYIAVEKVS
jgi:hypothetical protein